MDARLRQILELALRPDTGDGESSAALAAARRLVAKQGMELMGAPAPERIVYRDNIIHRKQAHEHTATYTLTIPASFHHTMMERVFLDAQELNCQVQLLSCTTKDKAILSGTILEFEVMGTKQSVMAYARMLDSYVDQMNSHTASHGPVPPVSTKGPKKKGNWFTNLFNPAQGR